MDNWQILSLFRLFFPWVVPLPLYHDLPHTVPMYLRTQAYTLSFLFFFFFFFFFLWVCVKRYVEHTQTDYKGQ